MSPFTHTYIKPTHDLTPPRHPHDADSVTGATNWYFASPYRDDFLSPSPRLIQSLAHKLVSQAGVCEGATPVLPNAHNKTL